MFVKNANIFYFFCARAEKKCAAESPQSKNKN